MWKHVGFIRRLRRASTSRIFSGLHHVSDTLRSASLDYATNGMDELSTDLSRRCYLHLATRDAPCHNPLYRRCPSSRASFAVHFALRRTRDNTREPRHTALCLGAFSGPQPSSSANEIQWRDFFRN